MLTQTFDINPTIHIQPATSDDIPAIAEIQLSALRYVFHDIVSQTYLNSLTLSHRIRVWEKFFNMQDDKAIRIVAVDAHNKPIGFAITGTPRDRTINYDVELYALYITPQYHRKKIGTMLLQHVAHELLKKNMLSLYLWCIENNPAYYFYTHLNAKPLSMHQSSSFGDAHLIEQALGWNTIEIILTYEQINL